MRTPSGSPTSQVSESSVFTQIQKIAQKYGMAITFVMAAGGLYQWTTAKSQAEQALLQSSQNTQTSANLVEATGNLAWAVSVLANNKSGSSDIKWAKQKLRDVQDKLRK